MADRIYLGDHAQKWKEEKAAFGAVFDKSKGLDKSEFFHLETGTGVPTPEFVRHLLEVHRTSCKGCHGTNTEDSGHAEDATILSPIKPAGGEVQGQIQTPVSKLKPKATSTPGPSLNKHHDIELLRHGFHGRLDRDSDTDDSDVEDEDEGETTTTEEVPGYICFRGAEKGLFFPQELNTSVEDIVFDVDEDYGGDENNEEEEEESVTIVSGKEDRSDAEKVARSLIGKEKGIVYVDILVDLVKQANGDNCERCGERLTYTHRLIGTCIKILWECQKGHRQTWDSQPRFRRQYAGNLHLALCILFSGNSFTKVALMFKFMNLSLFSADLFYRIQRLYAAPAVKSYWGKQQSELLEEATVSQPDGLVLAVDGRMDSPGFSAQYCTSSFMDTTSNKIVHFEVVDVREAAGKSTNMEKIGFQRGINFLKDKVKVSEVVTDAHPQIIPLMKATGSLSSITHQIDVWHGGKNLVKHLTKVAAPRSNEELQPWISAVRNHFWHCARMCNGSESRLKAMWLGILHHTVDEHEWEMMTDGQSPGKCDHQSLGDHRSTSNRSWMQKGSPAHKALTAVVTEKRLLRMLSYYRLFRHTGELESFHNHLLMYAPKRHSYKHTGYSTRNTLAAIDHNAHINRPIAKDKDGNDLIRLIYNRRSKAWTPQKVRVKKKYAYIPDLLMESFMKRFEDQGTLQQKSREHESAPMKIFSNRFMVEQPSKAQALEMYEQSQRFHDSDRPSTSSANQI